MPCARLFLFFFFLQLQIWLAQRVSSTVCLELLCQRHPFACLLASLLVVVRSSSSSTFARKSCQGRDRYKPKNCLCRLRQHDISPGKYVMLLRAMAQAKKRKMYHHNVKNSIFLKFYLISAIFHYVSFTRPANDNADATVICHCESLRIFGLVDFLEAQVRRILVNVLLVLSNKKKKRKE